MAKKNELIISLENIIETGSQEKKDRLKMLLDIGFFGVSDKEKERLLKLFEPKEEKPTKRKKSDGKQEETI
jgi:hypothetical protein